jgi:hypothetical protein
MTHAAARHRELDTAYSERLVRDGGAPVRGGSLLPSRLRNQDLRTMDRPKRPRVLLAQLSVRTSAKGNRYLSGWLGKASVVGFPGEPDKFGNETFDIFVSEPEPRPGTAPPAQRDERTVYDAGRSLRAGVDSAFDGDMPFGRAP